MMMMTVSDILGKTIIYRNWYWGARYDTIRHIDFKQIYRSITN